jgi:hypothetical protein
MALTKCPECLRDVSNRAASCPHCGYPLDSTRTPRFGLPASLQQGPKRKPAAASKPSAARSTEGAWVACPRCRGRRKVRDRGLLPWNNMASFALVLGVSGLIGSACLDQNQRALLLIGLVAAAVGVMLYVAGQQCPVCEGRGKVPGRSEGAGGEGNKDYVEVATDKEIAEFLTSQSRRRLGESRGGRT